MSFLPYKHVECDSYSFTLVMSIIPVFFQSGVTIALDIRVMFCYRYREALSVMVLYNNIK